MSLCPWAVTFTSSPYHPIPAPGGTERLQEAEVGDFPSPKSVRLSKNANKLGSSKVTSCEDRFLLSRTECSGHISKTVIFSLPL